MPHNKEPISFNKYSLIVLDGGSFQRQVVGCFTRANPDHWQIITHFVTPHKRFDCFRPNHWPFRKNHSLVIKGMAYWLNNETLVMGYNLLKDRNVYMPVFQPWKEKLNHELRMEIQKFAKFYAAEKRQKLYKKTLLGIPKLNILPEEIIHKIAHFTYDSLWYLKL